MTLILFVYFGLLLLETSLWLPFIWREKGVIAPLLMAGNILVPCALLFLRPSLGAICLLFLGLYRACNMLRILQKRLHVDHLYHATRRTSLLLIAMQLFVAGLWALISLSTPNLPPAAWLYALAAIQLLTSAYILAILSRQLRTTAPPTPQDQIHAEDLPSVSVLIPARNETTDLEACLRSLLSSTYKKLEIIVLDDCSQNKRTPEIIRGFAHDGVRFIAGEAPPEHWLAKNFAYQKLASEANGQLLFFCGVDARFSPDSLELIVQSMLQKNKSMVSLAPRNELPSHKSLLSCVVQPGRYGWEFLLPRRMLGRPPVLSTFWLITRDLLNASGGFNAVAQSVVPERYLARRAIEDGDGYSFMVASPAMGISSVKSFAQQQATAIRTRYPQLHRRTENVAAYSLLSALFLFGPFKLLVVAAQAHSRPLAVITAVTCLTLLYVGYRLVQLTFRRGLFGGLVLWPLILAYDIGLVNYSMWQYEFHEVIWKGRNVCVPVMQVIPHLPPLS